MATFTVHQLHRDLDETSLSDFQRLAFSDRDYTPEDFKFFNPVARVEAFDLEDVYHLTNSWWNPDAVHKFMPMHSVSVGDIIETHTGDHKYYMVARRGFNEIEVVNNECI